MPWSAGSGMLPNRSSILSKDVNGTEGSGLAPSSGNSRKSASRCSLADG